MIHEGYFSKNFLTVAEILRVTMKKHHNFVIPIFFIFDLKALLDVAPLLT